MATEPQINYFRSLVARRDTTDLDSMITLVERLISEENLRHATVKSAIDTLLARPEKAEPAARLNETKNHLRDAEAKVPEGHYAIGPEDDIKFYQVDKPTDGRWRGYTFVRIQAGDVTYPIKSQQVRAYVLNEIAKNPRGAAVRYGKKIGRCGICHRTLTNPESRDAGIGPVYAEKVGW